MTKRSLDDWRDGLAPAMTTPISSADLAERLAAHLELGATLLDGTGMELRCPPAYLRQAATLIREQSAELAKRDALGKAIAAAAIRAGIITGDQPPTGPQLVMLCEDLADSVASLSADADLLFDVFRADLRLMIARASTDSQDGFEAVMGRVRAWGHDRAIALDAKANLP